MRKNLAWGVGVRGAKREQNGPDPKPSEQELNLSQDFVSIPGFCPLQVSLC